MVVVFKGTLLAGFDKECRRLRDTDESAGSLSKDTHVCKGQHIDFISNFSLLDWAFRVLPDMGPVSQDKAKLELPSLRRKSSLISHVHVHATDCSHTPVSYTHLTLPTKLSV